MKQILFPPGQLPGTRKLITIRARVFPEQAAFLSGLDNPSGWLRDAIEAKRASDKLAAVGPAHFICGGCNQTVRATLSDDRIFICPNCGYTSQIGTH